MMNTTRKTIDVCKNFAFAYLDTIDSSAGVNLINVTDQEKDSGNDAQESILNDLKHALCNPPTLGFPSREKTTQIDLGRQH